MRRAALALFLAPLALDLTGCSRPVIGREFQGASITELTVEPENVRQGVPINIRFKLDGGPQGAVTYEIASRAAECLPTRLADGRYECVHPGVSRQDYPQGAVDVTVQAKDRIGKESTATARVTLDFDCPSFTALSITPAIGGPGTTAVVTIVASELLGEAPIVSRGGMLWENAAGSGNSYTVEHTVGDRDQAAASDVVVRIVDLAGNTSGDCGIDGKLSFGVDRETPEINAPFVQLKRDIPGEPATISALAGAFTDDVGVLEVQVFDDDGSGGGPRLIATLVPEDDGSLPETDLGMIPQSRVQLRAIDRAQNQSPTVYIGERWRLSAGEGTSPNSAVRTAVRYTAAAPGSRSMYNQTRQLASRIFDQDTESAEITAHVGFRQVGTLPAAYRDVFDIAGGYEPKTRSVVGFGGRLLGSEDARNETLILSWNELTGEYTNTTLSPGVSTPPARRGTNIAFDGMGCGVMFGGEGPERLFNDTWRLCATESGWAWTRIEAQNAPSSRITPILWDPVLRRYAISAGLSVEYDTDFYYLDPGFDAAGWRWVEVSGLPDRLSDTQRFYHAFYYDPTFHGYGLALGVVVPYFEGGAFWSYVDGLWIPSDIPFDLAGRTGFGYAHDDARSLLVVWGHDTDQIAEFDPDTWLLAGDPRGGAQSWRRVNLNPSVARGAPSLVYDADRESTLVFGGARFLDLTSVPPVVEEMVLAPSFPYLQASLDLAAKRPTGIQALELTVRATGVGDGDGVGPGTNRAGGVSVLLYDYDARAWTEVAAVDTPEAGELVTIERTLTDEPQRFVGFDGVVTVTVVSRWPATEDADARLDIDLIDGALVLAPQVPTGARIDAFSIDPEVIARGATATVSWAVSNASEGIELYADGTLLTTSAASVGTFEVSPTATTRYELRAKNAAQGDATARKMLGLLPNEAPPLILSFGSAKKAGPRGGSVRLFWYTERTSTVRVLRGKREIYSSSTMASSGSFDAVLPIDGTITSTSFTLEAKSDSGREVRALEIRLASTQIIHGPGNSQTFPDSIARVGEVDLYIVEMATAGYIDATIFVPSSPQCLAGIDTQLTLYDEDLEYLGYDDDDGPGNCSHIDRNDDFALVAAGTYYLEINDYNNDAAIVAYTLEVNTFGVECGNNVIEPGEGCDDGNTTDGDGCSSDCAFEALGVYVAPAGGRVVFPGAINPAGTIDVYQVQVTSTSYVTMETFAPNVAGGCPTGDTFIELLAGDMTTQLDYDDDDGVGYCSMIGALLTPGNYFVLVHELGDNGVIASYELVLDVVGNLQFEAEPNTTAAVATSVGTFGVAAQSPPFVAAISPVGDDDYFSFTLTQPATVTVRTFSDLGAPDACSGLDTTMSLLDSAQVEVAFNDDSAAGGCAQLDGIGGVDVALENLPAGTYYLLVQEYQEDDVITSYFVDVQTL